jgi:hypothetical protein
MVGFDMHPSGAPRDIDPREAQRRRRENMERFAGRNMAYARAMGFETESDTAGSGGLMGGAAPRNNSVQNDSIQPERRLSRELEAGFRDDSDDDDDDDDDERGVTVGRRSFSAAR